MEPRGNAWNAGTHWKYTEQHGNARNITEMHRTVHNNTGMLGMRGNARGGGLDWMGTRQRAVERRLQLTGVGAGMGGGGGREEG